MTEPNPLDALVGEWTLQGTMPIDPPVDFRGRATFERLGAFLVYRATIDDQPEFPSVLAVIELDDAATGECTQHYFDSRGVKRTYHMRLTPESWELWRDSDEDDFSQRFIGNRSADGATVDGAWEIAEDKTTWKHDFAVTYRKLGSR